VRGRALWSATPWRDMVSPVFNSGYPSLTAKNSKNSNKTPQTLNTKVVEHLYESIFLKDDVVQPMFPSYDWKTMQCCQSRV
jgi:hypothetical protein